MTTEQVCTDCGELFESTDALDRHHMDSGHAQAFKCDECAAGFASKADLDNHLAEVHKAEADPPIR